MGHFFFVASVSHQMKDMYQVYCDQEKNRPNIKGCKECDATDVAFYSSGRVIKYRNHGRVACGTDTFYRSSVFSSMACAKLWYRITNQRRKEANTMFCRLIAQTGNLEILQWARQKKFPWDKETCVEAAFHGHLSILKYAHENECPWDDYVCNCAAGRGQLECLQYCHENGCSWDDLTCASAA